MIDLLSTLSDFMNTQDPENLSTLETSKGLFPALLWWKDIHGKYLGNNKLHALTHGLNHENDPLGLSDTDLWPLNAPNYIQNDQTVMAYNKSIFIVETNVPQKNNISHYLSYKKPLRLRTKKLLGTIGISFPITQDSPIVNLLTKFNLEEYATPSMLYKEKLTRRQVDCLYHITKGFRSKEIASKLNVSPRTIEHHIEVIKKKLRCYTRADLVAQALQMPEIKSRL